MPISPPHPPTTSEHPRKASLDRRVAVLFRALPFILAGAICLFPEERIPMRLLPTILGALALLAGLADSAGAHLPLRSMTLISTGASIFELLVARRA